MPFTLKCKENPASQILGLSQYTPTVRSIFEEAFKRADYFALGLPISSEDQSKSHTERVMHECRRLNLGDMTERTAIVMVDSRDNLIQSGTVAYTDKSGNRFLIMPNYVLDQRGVHYKITHFIYAAVVDTESRFEVKIHTGDPRTQDFFFRQNEFSDNKGNSAFDAEILSQHFGFTVDLDGDNHRIYRYIDSSNNILTRLKALP